MFFSQQSVLVAPRPHNVACFGDKQTVAFDMLIIIVIIIIIIIITIGNVDTQHLTGTVTMARVRGN